MSPAQRIRRHRRWLVRSWRKARARFERYPLAGVTEDGAAIRAIPGWGLTVLERSGYGCSPGAYNSRRAMRHMPGMDRLLPVWTPGRPPHGVVHDCPLLGRAR